MEWLTFFVCKKRRMTNELLASNEIMRNSRNHVLFQVQIKSSCFSSIMRGVVTQSPEPEAHVLCVQAFWVDLEFRSAGFWGEGKTESTRGKTSRSRERTNNKLSAHMVRAQNRTRGHIGGRLHQPCSPSQNQKIEAVQKVEWCLCSIGAYVCHLEIKLRWNKLLCSQEIMNRHFERKECFSAASCKVLCEFLTEANVRYLLSDACRIMTSMPMFATYRVKVEIIISEVLMAFLWESRAWKVQVQERFTNFLLVIEICLVIPVQTHCHERGNSCLNRIICDFRSTLGVSTVEAHMCISINGVVSLEHYHWQDEIKRTKKSERIFVHFTVTNVWLVKN